MSLTKNETSAVLNGYGRKPGDSGSPEVQVALLTARIKHLTEHVKANKQDVHARVGLLKLVNQRRKMLTYLKRVAEPRYQDLIERLGLRK